MKAFITYLKTVFKQLDCLEASSFGGPPNVSISMNAALAKESGRRWGCILCQWLHWTLRQRHCQRTLLRESMSLFAALSAAVQILALGFLLYFVPAALVLALLWRVL